MDRQTAIWLIGDTFNFPFDEGRFRNFALNLLNDVDEKKDSIILPALTSAKSRADCLLAGSRLLMLRPFQAFNRILDRIVLIFRPAGFKFKQSITFKRSAYGELGGV